MGTVTTILAIAAILVGVFIAALGVAAAFGLADDRQADRERYLGGIFVAAAFIPVGVLFVIFGVIEVSR